MTEVSSNSEDEKLLASDEVELDDLTSEVILDLERQKNWAQWLGIDDLEKAIWSDIETSHPEEEQIQMDVERSFVFYHDGHKEQLKKELYDLIVQVLRKHPQLSYYQGFHDIAQVILLVYGPKQARPILETLSLRYLRDFMLPTLSPTLEQLTLIPGLLAKYESELANILVSKLGSTPFYALSPILTLYSHHIRSFKSICKIFDYIFESQSMETSLFIYVSLILHEKSRLLQPNLDSDIIFSLLTNFVDELHGSDIDIIIERSRNMASEVHLSDLKEWQTVSEYSVLKQSPSHIDTSDIDKCIIEHSKEPPMELGHPEKPAKNKDPSTGPTFLSIALCVVAITVYYYLATEDI